MRVINPYNWSSPEEAVECFARNPQWGDVSEWAAVTSHQDAMDRARHGDNSTVPQSEAALEEFSNLLPDTSRKTWAHEVAGAFPDVPRYLQGADPRTMRRRRREASDTAPIRVYVDMACSSGNSAAIYAKRGAVIIALIQAIAARRPLELFACSMILPDRDITPRDRLGYVTCRLPSGPINLALLQSWFGHIGVFRGNLLRLSCAEIATFGRGVPVKSEQVPTIRAALNFGPNDLYIPGLMLDDPSVKNPQAWLVAALKFAKLIPAE